MIYLRCNRNKTKVVCGVEMIFLFKYLNNCNQVCECMEINLIEFAIENSSVNFLVNQFD